MLKKLHVVQRGATFAPGVLRRRQFFLTVDLDDPLDGWQPVFFDFLSSGQHRWPGQWQSLLNRIISVMNNPFQFIWPKHQGPPMVDPAPKEIESEQGRPIENSISAVIREFWNDAIKVPSSLDSKLIECGINY